MKRLAELYQVTVVSRPLAVPATVIERAGYRIELYQVLGPFSPPDQNRSFSEGTDMIGIYRIMDNATGKVTTDRNGNNVDGIRNLGRAFDELRSYAEKREAAEQAILEMETPK